MRMPTGVIVGGEGFATPVAISEQIKQAMPNATLSILPKVRHLAPTECPTIISDETPARGREREFASRQRIRAA